MSVQRKLRVIAHPWRLGVERHARDTAPPAPADDGLYAVVRSAESLTVVRALGAGGEAWRALEIAGPFAFTETGIVSAIAQPLAEAGISIFIVNSFETEFVLVREADLSAARAALAAVGHTLS